MSRALSSIEKQSWQNLEVVVVDDNGLDTKEQILTAQVVDRFQERLQIVYLANKLNVGGAAARNIGVQHSQGDYLAFLDDDDEWLPQFLDRGIEKLEVSDNSVVYCDCFIVTEENPDNRRLEVNRKYDGIVRDHLLSGWCPSSTSLFIVKRETLDASQNTIMFDENLKSFQDFDCWLAISHQCRFVSHQEALVIKHRHSREQITTNTDNRRKALQILAEKWLSTLNEHEQDIFKKTLGSLESDILIMEFEISIRNRQLTQSMSRAWRFLTFETFSVRSWTALLKTVIRSF